MVLRRAMKAAQFARYGAYVLWEKLAHPRPKILRVVPYSAEAITPEWLAQILCRGWPSARITEVRCVGGTDGTSNRRALEVSYNGAGRAAGLPTHLFTKATTGLRQRALLNPIGRAQSEVEFFRQYRHLLDIEAPTALYSGFHHRSGRSLIIFPDMVKDEGVRFLDPGQYVSRSMIEEMLQLIARYQARFWNHPDLGSRSWFRTTLDYQRKMSSSYPFDDICDNGVQRASSVLPRELLERRADLPRAHMRSIELSCRAPMTLVHWDVHIGNWYVTADGRVGLSDWSLKAGQWACDFSYLLGSALTVEDRRAWETELLAYHLELLESYGLANLPTFDEARLAYQQQMFHAFFWWTSTIGTGVLQPKMQPDGISLSNLARIGRALIDLNSFEAVERDST